MGGRGVLGDVRGRALGVVLGALVCQLGLGFGYALGALAPPILDELGFSRAQWSAGRIPQLCLMAVASAPLGLLVSRWGSRPVLLAAVALLGATLGLLATMQTLLHYYALVGLLGFALVGVGDIAAGQIVMDWVTRGRALALGLVYTGSNLGGALFAWMASRVADAGSWRTALAALAAFALLFMLPIAAVSLRERRRAADAGRGAEAAADAGALGRVHEGGDLPLRLALRRRSFWILAFSLTTFFAYFLGVLDHLVLFLTDVGMSLADAGGWFGSAIVLGVGGKLGFGLVADRLPPKTAVLLDYGLLTLASLLLLALPGEGYLLAFVVVHGFATAARDVVTPLIVAHCFGARYMAEIYGALMLSLMLGGVGGPLFAGLVHDRTGSYAPAFAVLAALNVAAFLALWWLRPERAAEREA